MKREESEDSTKSNDGKRKGPMWRGCLLRQCYRNVKEKLQRLLGSSIQEEQDRMGSGKKRDEKRRGGGDNEEQVEVKEEGTGVESRSVASSTLKKNFNVSLDLPSKRSKTR